MVVCMFQPKDGLFLLPKSSYAKRDICCCNGENNERVTTKLVIPVKTGTQTRGPSNLGSWFLRNDEVLSKECMFYTCATRITRSLA